jgi:hypothetical protein
MEGMWWMWRADDCVHLLTDNLNPTPKPEEEEGVEARRRKKSGGERRRTRSTDL